MHSGMESLTQLKEDVKSALLQGVDAALDRLKTLLSPSSALFVEAQKLENQYQDIVEQNKQGLLTPAAHAKALGNIRAQLQQNILWKWQKSDFLPEVAIADVDAYAAAKSLFFDRRTFQYPTDLWPLLFGKEREQFRQQLDRLKARPVQHFLWQKRGQSFPIHSLLSHLVRSLEVDAQPVVYQASPQRLLLETYSLSDQAVLNQLHWQSLFSRQYSIQVSELQQLVYLLEEEEVAPRVVFLFRVDPSRQSKVTEAFFDWMIKEFCRLESNTAIRFLFFHLFEGDFASSHRMDRKKERVWKKLLERWKTHPNVAVLEAGDDKISKQSLQQYLTSFMQKPEEIESLVGEMSRQQGGAQNFDRHYLHNYFQSLAGQSA